MKTYIRDTVKEESEVTYAQAVKLCCGEMDFCLYENGEEISVGIGKFIEICVTRETIIVITENQVNKKPFQDLSEDLEKILDKLELDDWRLYGIANFSLARYTYDLPIGKEDEVLLRLFIPKKEYRISGCKVEIKAFTDSEIGSMKKRLEKAIYEKSDLFMDETDRVVSSEMIVNYDEEYYKKIVHTGVEEISRGYYQKVILSRKIPVNGRLDMITTYLAGRKANTPARSYIYKMDDMEVVGFSPETVAEVDKYGIVYTFPLAGTRKLTSDPEENIRLKGELLHDTKEIAEHAVSVKLAEEELQQICEENSVVITEFMSVMERGTVQHLGSRLRGQMKKGYNAWHALCKLFPAVTASGIPKKEAIEAIGRIEKDARDLYSGTVLIADKNGYLDAALVLRSIFQDKQHTWVRVGAGIVELSNPEREFTETQEKVSSIAKLLILEK